jgi:hypothetical protein
MTDSGEAGDPSLPARSVDPAAYALDALVVSGLPIDNYSKPPDRTVCPSTTLPILKLMRLGGIRIGFADEPAPVELAHKSADFLVPVIVFSKDVLVAGAAEVLANAVVELIGPRRIANTTVHAKIGRIRTKGTDVEWLEVHGDGAQVVDAIRAFRGD